jgi:hypothetical protein
MDRVEPEAARPGIESPATRLGRVWLGKGWKRLPSVPVQDHSRFILPILKSSNERSAASPQVRRQRPDFFSGLLHCRAMLSLRPRRCSAKLRASQPVFPLLTMGQPRRIERRASTRPVNGETALCPHCGATLEFSERFRFDGRMTPAWVCENPACPVKHSPARAAARPQTVGETSRQVSAHALRTLMKADARIARMKQRQAKMPKR